LNVSASIKERVSVDLVCSFEMLSMPYQLARENMEAGVHFFEDIHVVFPQDTGHYKYARNFGTGKVGVTGPLSTIDITGFRPWKWLIDRFYSPTFCSVRKLIEERGVASQVSTVGLVGGVSTCTSLRVALFLWGAFIGTFFLFRDKGLE
jgi:hypothetical protein